MPEVNGKKFPYTKAGIKAAKKASKKKAGGSMLKKRTPAKGNYSRGY